MSVGPGRGVRESVLVVQAETDDTYGRGDTDIIERGIRNSTSIRNAEVSITTYPYDPSEEVRIDLNTDEIHYYDLTEIAKIILNTYPSMDQDDISLTLVPRWFPKMDLGIFTSNSILLKFTPNIDIQTEDTDVASDIILELEGKMRRGFNHTVDVYTSGENIVVSINSTSADFQQLLSAKAEMVGTISNYTSANPELISSWIEPS